MKTKKIILSILFFISLGLNSFSQAECKKFKVGKYILSDPSINFEMVVERSDSIQIERNMITGMESKYIIDWKNDCEYSLKILNGPKDDMAFYKDKLLFVKIVATENNKYTFEASIQGLDFKVTQVMHRFD